MTSENLVTAGQGTSADAEVIATKKIEKLPVVDESNTLIGLITFRDITKLTQKPIANKDGYELRVAAAVGVTADAIDRVEALLMLV